MRKDIDRFCDVVVIVRVQSKNGNFVTAQIRHSPILPLI